jgi:hypothetical protein
MSDLYFADDSRKNLPLPLASTQLRLWVGARQSTLCACHQGACFTNPKWSLFHADAGFQSCSTYILSSGHTYPQSLRFQIYVLNCFFFSYLISQIREAYTILVGKPKVRRPFTKPRHRLERNVMQCSLLGIYWTTRCNIPEKKWSSYSLL